MNFPLKKSSKIPILLDFIDLDVALGQLVFECGFFIGVDDVDWVFDLPYFVAAGFKFGQFFDIFLNFVIGDGKMVDFCAKDCIFSGQITVGILLIDVEGFLIGEINGRVVLGSVVTITACCSHYSKYYLQKYFPYKNLIDKKVKS